MKFYRGHCFNDKGEMCPHIKGDRDDTPGDEVTMGCEYGEKYCPYVKDEQKMGIGRAVAICERLDSEKYSVEDKLLAIHEVMNMPTHMGVKKDTLIGMIKWLWNINLEVSDSHSGKRIIEVQTPHGRLIDADRLIAVLKSTVPYEYRKDPPFPEIIKMIENQPTIIEAEDTP